MVTKSWSIWIGLWKKKWSSSGDILYHCVKGCQIESNRIECFCRDQIESNADRIEWLFLFSIQFDSIWEKMWARKLWTVTVKKIIISKDGMSNEIFQYFCHPGGQSLWNMPIYWWPIKFDECWGGFVSNRFFFCIESILNRNQIEWKGFCNISIKNRIESKPIRFDSPESVFA